MPLVYKEEKQRALALRQEGKSYREIQKAIGVRSRSTLSLWFKDLKLSPSAKKILDAKKAQTLSNVLKWSKERSKNVREENHRITVSSSKAIGKLSERDMLFIGVALYWGEGSLRLDKKGYYRFKFSNSSPEMVSVFLHCIRTVLKITDEDIRPYVHIHKNIKAEDAIAFWSIVTKLPKEKFTTYDAVSSAGKFKRPANFLPYGTVHLGFNGRQNYYKIKGFIDGIIKQIN